MNLLAIETSSSACSVALYLNGEVQVIHEVAPMQQTRLLLPMIDQLLSKNNLSVKDLNAIAYGQGPGSFTGIRIASSVTQGLAFSANLPVIPVSSLAAIAQASYNKTPHSHYLVVVDARMGQVYYGHYAANAAGYVELTAEEALIFPSEMYVSNKTIDYAAVGDGWKTHRASLAEALELTPNWIDPDQLPTAAAVLKLALVSYEQKKTISATESLPSYLIKR